MLNRNLVVDVCADFFSGLYRPVALVMIVILAMLSGCESVPYDYSALERAKPRSILVLPPTNDAVAINAPYKFLSTISVPLAEKGYYVFPVAVIDTFMKENGLPSPAEMNSIPLDKLRETIGADAVLYVNIEQWGQKFELLSSRAVVAFSMRLVDAKTGDQLWHANGFAQQSSGDGGQGIAGAIMGAIATQIAGSVSDQTPALSRTATHATINHPQQGLLSGPYLKKMEAASNTQ